ncbi:MAG: CRISPR-associated helicase Cas3' [Rubripirellula sp.]
MREHEEQVAILCSQFLHRIHPDLAAWGDLLGRWHDIGKYSREFQEYLSSSNDPESTSETKSRRINHSSAGAQLAYSCLPNGIRDMFAYVTAGHHAGLADRVSATGQKRSGLDERLKANIPEWKSLAPPELLSPPALILPKVQLCLDNSRRCGFQLSLICRLLFSALCDADFLATEQFMSPSMSKEREHRPEPSMEDLRLRLGAYLERFDSSNPSEVNRCRQEVRNASLNASRLVPGLFSFTVPTGGGKTLSSLSFALNHAVIHGKHRVIYAIPFTSIIDQTAKQFRQVFGDDVVLEHHSNTDPETESRIARLVSQNWDSRLVVTTNVQFFESLFANRTSRCRKLHRIANSVIVLDEVQTLPVELLAPCLSALRELVDLCGCTIVLCTATQPAIKLSDAFPIGLQNVTEIIPDPPKLYERMRRVSAVQLGKVDDVEIAHRIASESQTLCIVNTRAHASDLFSAVKELTSEECPTDVNVFHLSTFMCAAHRSSTFTAIRNRLTDKTNPACRVISTQLIEAGVDIDFPVVFRALSGLDSIAQAAGRCNREGKLDKGLLYLFEPAGRSLRGYLRSTAETAQEVVPLYDDPLSLEAVEHYFRLHYWNQNDQWDAKEILSLFADPRKLTFQFRSAAERFRFIEDNSQSVFVPWSAEGVKIESQIRCSAFAIDPKVRRAVLRRAQRFMVPVFDNVFRSLLGSDIEMLHESVAILANMSLYSEELGFDSSKHGYIEPESAIC